MSDNNRAVMGDEMLEKHKVIEDFLTDIYNYQKKFQERFFKASELSVEDKEKWTKEMVFSMHDELSEVMGWINWKHWKQPKYPINESEIKFELIDILHFLMNLFIIWDMKPEEIYNYYVSKNKENIDRQNRKY